MSRYEVRIHPWLCCQKEAQFWYTKSYSNYIKLIFCRKNIDAQVVDFSLQGTKRILVSQVLWISSPGSTETRDWENDHLGNWGWMRWEWTWTQSVPFLKKYPAGRAETKHWGTVGRQELRRAWKDPENLYEKKQYLKTWGWALNFFWRKWFREEDAYRGDQKD